MDHAMFAICKLDGPGRLVFSVSLARGTRRSDAQRAAARPADASAHRPSKAEMRGHSK